MSFDFELTPREQARLDAVTAKLVSDAAAEGLTVDRAALVNLPSVRMAVLTDLGIDANALAEVRRIPAVAEQAHARDVAAELNRADSPAHAELARMNPTQRMNWARENQLPASVGQPRRMDAVEEAQAIKMCRAISNPVERLNAARAIGLVR